MGTTLVPIKKMRTEEFFTAKKEELASLKAQPYYGLPQAKNIYEVLNKRYNVRQVSVCGSFVRIVHTKKYSAEMFSILRRMFPDLKVNQTTSEYTGLVTTAAIPANTKEWILQK